MAWKDLSPKYKMEWMAAHKAAHPNSSYRDAVDKYKTGNDDIAYPKDEEWDSPLKNHYKMSPYPANETSYQFGGNIINDNNGQWAHPGEITRINSNNITMKGVNYPVLGVSDEGHTQLMLPNKNYKFKGNKVVEYPLRFQDGGTLDTKPKYSMSYDNQYNQQNDNINNQYSNDIKNTTNSALYNKQKMEDYYATLNDSNADIKFREKYQTSPHRYRYDNDPKYKQETDSAAKAATSKVYQTANVDPNAMFMLPNKNISGQAAEDYQNFHKELISNFIPIPGIAELSKGKNLVKEEQFGKSIYDKVIYPNKETKLSKDLEPYLSKKVLSEPDQDKIFNSFLTPEAQAKKELERTISYDKNGVVSEINWENWNKEIPDNKKLIDEYSLIEQNSKRNGTWMKNKDGSEFKGTPEQFVQQNSENFKKAFGNSKLINPDGSPTIQYHGSAKKFDTFDESKFQLGDSGYSGQGIYTTPSKTTANSYATSSVKFHKGDIQPTVYELYGQANNPISSSQLIKESSNKDLFNFHRKANWKGALSSEEALMNYDAAIADQLPNVSNIRPWNDAREIVFPSNRQLKSAVGNNGMFDMTNPNIYKSLLALGYTKYQIDQMNNK